MQSLLLLLAAGTAAARPAAGARTLVLLDAAADAQRFAAFLHDLEGRGHVLDMRSAGDLAKGAFGLVSFDELVYDHAVILAPKAPSFGGALKIGNLVDFVNAGGNVLLTASSEVSEAVRDFAYEFTADFDEPGTAVIDRFNSVGTDPTRVLSSAFSPSASNVVSDAIRSGPPVLFKGVAHKLSGKNPLSFSVLSASSAAFAYDPTDKQRLIKDPLAGHAISLISAFQARNNARVVFAGSADMFSDEFFDATITVGDKTVASGNRRLASEVSQWAFQEKSVLRIEATKHHRVGESGQHGIYRIKDEMEYEADIQVWDGEAWVPFVASDVQFEAVMLDPYVRATMNASGGHYSARFTLPDQHGVFTFKLDYKRHGLSYIHASETVQVRPFRHDQYPRFLTVAFPYYANIFSMMAGFFVFSLLFVFNRDTNTKVKAKTQ
nr:hypothetical protein HK105_005359 [Polyrhizophydium stewartii]